ncbi:MAG: class I SAM-dependent methyltransferase [Comamonadaceae bacterium]|nr:class I SAM-dependent methyltransferase [Comamonadaceae bacterium]
MRHAPRRRRGTGAPRRPPRRSARAAASAPELREGIADFRPRPRAGAAVGGLRAGALAASAARPRAPRRRSRGTRGLRPRRGRPGPRAPPARRGAASVVAIDGDPGALAALGGAEARITPIVKPGLESLPFREHFDVLVCRGALQRVVNVASLLHSLDRAVRVGGRLVVPAADRPGPDALGAGRRRLRARAAAPPHAGPWRAVRPRHLGGLRAERVEEESVSGDGAQSGGHGLLVVRARKRAHLRVTGPEAGSPRVVVVFYRARHQLPLRATKTSPTSRAGAAIRVIA